MLASLNHRRIAALFGMEHVEGQHFLVMELIEGETLAERLDRGRMDVEDALPIAIQIAEALEAAHEKGVVHRDLKPANVKITPEGEVKVLDFGLAKVMETEAASGSVANSPTLSMMATQAGPDSRYGRLYVAGTGERVSRPTIAATFSRSGRSSSKC